MNFKCSTCFNNKFFIKTVGNHEGLYCSNCGKFFKWATDSETDLLKYRGQIVEESD